MSNNVENKKVHIDLEIDTNVNTNTQPEPPLYTKIKLFGRAIDAWRIFPRIFISVYLVLLYQSVTWFMALPDPNTQQASLLSIMTGVGAAWFGLYVSTGSSSRD